MGLLKNIIKTTAVTGLAAGIASYATNTDTLWNKTQLKPSWQPPEEVFPIAWSALYASIAGASAAVLTKLDNQADEAHDDPEELARIHRERRKFKRALGVNLALNATWSALYWNVRDNWLSAAEITLLASSSIHLAYRAGKVCPAAGVALIPYAGWTAFATALNIEIAHLNS
ncbi:tryptophan-rich sensory protein [Arcanobacterium phocisimile]|uniref:Tryptophan-rich sensory protein n=1 Tax=Arcanobacterium phocisimile TaxID=1302235 RepID=A0ABX7IGU6_9ACTO|nr:TspO/MBR family protein [Arcanobacterium phocisimile]QRV02344.1 tryptophan-rich sensory protein [Arcanobacterium phocisimile]